MVVFHSYVSLPEGTSEVQEPCEEACALLSSSKTHFWGPPEVSQSRWSVGGTKSVAYGACDFMGGFNSQKGDLNSRKKRCFVTEFNPLPGSTRYIVSGSIRWPSLRNIAKSRNSACATWQDEKKSGNTPWLEHGVSVSKSGPEKLGDDLQITRYNTL